MTKIIGGILVVSLLYGPVTYQVKFFASLAKNVSNVEYRFIGKTGDDYCGATSDDIDYAFEELDDNTHKISELINEKNMLYNKIESELDLRSHLKIALSEQQINDFAGFMECYNRETVNIQYNLEQIEKKINLDLAQKALLHNDANYDLIFTEINNITRYQNDAISSIISIIDSGNNMLQAL